MIRDSFWIQSVTIREGQLHADKTFPPTAASVDSHPQHPLYNLITTDYKCACAQYKPHLNEANPLLGFYQKIISGWMDGLMDSDVYIQVSKSGFFP